MPREAVLSVQLDRRLGVAAQVHRLGRHRRVVGPPPETVLVLASSDLRDEISFKIPAKTRYLILT